MKNAGGGDSGSFHDPFSSFFGDFFHSNRQHEEGTLRGADVIMDLWVTLEEVYNGNFVEIKRFIFIHFFKNIITLHYLFLR